jgi:hypothetical protein
MRQSTIYDFLEDINAQLNAAANQPNTNSIIRTHLLTILDHSMRVADYDRALDCIALLLGLSNE